MTYTEIKNQTKLIIIAIHNLAFNMLLFHTLKNFYLRLTGTKIGKNSYIHLWTQITMPGRLKIGNNCTVNPGCYLDTRGYITIGNNVMIGHRSRIYTVSHDLNMPDFRGCVGPVVIEDNVVVFPNSIIMPGVVIEEGAIVFPGSVVTRRVPAYSMVGGNPAKYVKDRKKEIEYALDYKYWFPNS